MDKPAVKTPSRSASSQGTLRPPPPRTVAHDDPRHVSSPRREEAHDSPPPPQSPSQGMGAATPQLDYEHPQYRWVLWLVIGIVVIAMGVFIGYRIHQSRMTALATPRGRGRFGIPPVVVVVARTGDMPIFLSDPGNVVPINVVTIHTRVDGQLMKIYFKEGQIVHAGETLALVDPRPYQAALEQMEGQLARDQAILLNAQLDLKRYLGAPDTVTAQTIDTQRATVAQDQGVVESDQGQLDNARVNLNYCTITAPISGRIGLLQVTVGNLVQSTDATGIAAITQLQPIYVQFPIAQEDLAAVMGDSPVAPPLRVDAYDAALQHKLATGTLSAVDSEIDTTTDTVRMHATFANQNFELFPNEFVNANILVKTLRNVVIIPNSAVQHGPNNETFVYVVQRNAATQPSKESDEPAHAGDEANRGAAGGHGARGDASGAGFSGTVQTRDVVVDPQVQRAVQVQQQGAAGDGASGQAMSVYDDTVIDSGLNPGEMVVVTGVDKLTQGAKVTAHLQPTEAAGASPATRQSGVWHRGGATTRRSHRRQPQAAAQ